MKADLFLWIQGPGKHFTKRRNVLLIIKTQLGVGRLFYGKPLSKTQHQVMRCLRTVSSSIIENTINHCKSRASHACAYFFFDGRDTQKQLRMHESLIRSLIMQFSDQCGGLPAVLVELYKGCNNGHQEPSMDVLQNTLQSVLDGFSGAYIIIDSLDECAERGKLLHWLTKITSWKVGKVHLVVTSRPERDIEDHLQVLDSRRVCLTNERENRDIEIYLGHMLQQDGKLKRWDEGVRSNIKDVLMERAQGMYVSLNAFML